MEENKNSWTIRKWVIFTLVFGGIITSIHILYLIFGNKIPSFILIGFKYVRLIIIVPTTYLLANMALLWDINSYSWIWDSLTYFVFFGIIFLPLLTNKKTLKIPFLIISLSVLTVCIISSIRTIIEWGL